jgi:cell wall-associated NlpC family hydrolase
VIGSSKKRFALWFVTAAVVALAATAGVLATPSGIQTRQAEAQHVLDEIQAIDSELDRAVDAYNLANERLASLRAGIAANRRHLAIARQAARVAEHNLEQRLVALYVNGGDESTIEVILGATSIDDLLDRIDAAKRVSKQDARIVAQVRASRREIRARESALEKALREQKKVVAERTARKAEIQRRLTERQALYNSIKDEIARLEAQERARQERLAREAEQRLLQQEQGSAGGAVAAIDPNGLGLAPPAVYTGAAGVALQYLGVPYQWGGSSPGTGFDCSGFVMFVYAQLGVSLPHNAAAQYGYGVAVSRDGLQPGDLVFFDGLGHNGIYIGGGQFVHSPHTGDVVKISSLDDSWYAATYVGARRIV